MKPYILIAAFFAGIGVLLILFSGPPSPNKPFPEQFQQRYAHQVESINESGLPASECDDALAYLRLSENGQDVFKAALEAPDGRAFVYGATNTPEEFRYFEYPGHSYVIEHEGECYVLRAIEAGSMVWLRVFLTGLLAVVTAVAFYVSGRRDVLGS